MLNEREAKEPTMLILVADDHEENREMLARRLMRKGYTVLEATDGVEAVQRWRAHRPTVILMDISMPNRNGIEATQDIVAEAGGDRPKIIALTAHAMDDMRRLCLEAGCDAFATKPVDFPALLKAIEQ